MSAYADRHVAYHEERIEALHAIQALADARTPRAAQTLDVPSMIVYHENQIRLIRMADQMIADEEH